jgi:hypothetical protein
VRGRPADPHPLRSCSSCLTASSSPLAASRCSWILTRWCWWIRLDQRRALVRIYQPERVNHIDPPIVRV